MWRPPSARGRPIGVRAARDVSGCRRDELYRRIELSIRSGEDEIVIDRAAEHSSWGQANARSRDKFLARPRQRMVEIGARARSGITRREMFGACDYIGFDVLPGENVDVVGDAHFLSQHIDGLVDAVASLSTFEHLIIAVESSRGNQPRAQARRGRHHPDASDLAGA